MLREQANAALVAEQKHLHIARPSGDERVNGCSLEAHCTHLRPFMSSAAAGGVSRHGRPLDTPRLPAQHSGRTRSEEHTSELQSLMRISYAVFCLKKKTKNKRNNTHRSSTPTQSLIITTL